MRTESVKHETLKKQQLQQKIERAILNKRRINWMSDHLMVNSSNSKTLTILLQHIFTKSH